MISLTAFPADVLYSVALNFERDPRTLRSLNLVCHIFYRATRALLFKHIARNSPETKDLLQRSLAVNPDLLLHVQSYDISLCTEDSDEHRLEQVLA